jgi:hypothetical protein
MSQGKLPTPTPSQPCQTTAEATREKVREAYAGVASQATAGCCGPSDADRVAKYIGYAAEALAASLLQSLAHVPMDVLLNTARTVVRAEITARRP